jgi:hypothetical protein
MEAGGDRPFARGVRATVNAEDLVRALILCRLIAIVLLALTADGAAQSPPLQTLRLHASVVTHPAPFKKYLYSFPLPGQVTFRALEGSVSTNQSLPGFSEALISLHELPHGRCPQNGEVYDTYEEIGRKYPGNHSLANFIVKNAHGGVSTVATQFALPAGIPIANCAVVILDGSILTGGAFTMTSNMTMTYVVEAPPPSPRIIGLDDEFCFGQSWGCQLHSVDTSRSFAKIVAIPSPLRLLALYGDISDSTFTPGGNFAPPPRGAWGMVNDFTIIRDCAKLPKGIVGPGDFYAQIPGGSTPLLNVTMHGNGQGTLQQPVFQAFADTTLQAGDCIAHLVKMSGAGGVDAENQVFALVAPF